MPSERSLWVVLLAGGDGRRLAAATMDHLGAHVPKQFCRFGSNRSLLSHALGRARQFAGPDRFIAVVQEAHRRWWQPELADLPPGNVIAQRANSGTAVALLHAVAHVLLREADAHVLVLPSDQQVEDEQAWAGTLRRAIDASFGAPRHVVIVGVEAQPDPDFGWILPGEWVDDGTRAVLGFVEKPGALQAMRLARAGALCSSFTFAASATALLAVLRRHRSRRFNRFASAPDAARMLAALEATAPHELPHSDFSHDLIERATQWVRVVSGAPCGWTDLGTPERLARWLARSSPRTAAGEATLPAARARAVPAASAPARTRGHATAASLSDGDTTCVR